jgi:hypothetical protein
VVRIDLPGEVIEPEVLREALAGGMSGLPATAVLARIAGADLPDVDRASLLRDVARDSGTEVAVRTGAMSTLTRIDWGLALSTAVDLIEDENDLLASTAALALGRLGEADQLETLERARRAASGSLTRRAAAFAEMPIVHRLGLTDRQVELPEFETLPTPAGSGAISLVSVRPGAYRREEAIQQVSADLPWVETARRNALELQCGARLLEIVVADDLVTRTGRQALLERPAIPAVVAARSVERDEFTTSLLALSRPTAAGTLSVLVTRLTGEPVYAGEAVATDSGLDVTFHAVRAPGSTAVAVRARLTDDGLEITGISGRTPEEPTQTPQRMSSPDRR